MTDYSKKEYRLLYDSILYLYNYERMLYQKLPTYQQNELLAKLTKSITKIEQEVDQRQQAKVISKIYDEILEEHNS